MKIAKSKVVRTAGGTALEIVLGVGVTLVTQLIATKLLGLFAQPATPLEEVVEIVEEEFEVEYEEDEEEEAI